MKRTRRMAVSVGAIVLVPLFVSNTASAVEPAPCDVRLTVELTPDVPNPMDAGFLGSLLTNHVGYLLSLRRERRDGRVLSVHVDKKPT